MRSKLALTVLASTFTAASLAPTRAHAIFGVGDIVVDLTAAANAVRSLANDSASLINEGMSLANEAQALYNQGQALLNDVQRIEQEARNLASADFGDVTAYLRAYERGRDRFNNMTTRVKWFRDEAESWFDRTYPDATELDAAVVGMDARDVQEYRANFRLDNHDVQKGSMRTANDIANTATEREEAIKFASQMSQESQRSRRHTGADLDDAGSD